MPDNSDLLLSVHISAHRSHELLTENDSLLAEADALLKQNIAMPFWHYLSPWHRNAYNQRRKKFQQLMDRIEANIEINKELSKQINRGLNRLKES